jgi:lipoprotein-releasing system permease protein
VNLARFIARRFSSSLRRDGFSRFTTIVSTASVALGCVALIVSTSVLAGYEELIKETALTYTSHLEVRATGTTGIAHAELLQHHISAITGVRSVVPVLQREALAKTRAGVDGILLSTPLSRESGQNTVTIGAEVARRLDLQVGDTLLVYTADSLTVGATPRLFTVPIGGILTTGMQSLDESLVQMPMQLLHDKLGMSDLEPTLLAITLDDPELAADGAREIDIITGGRLVIVTWKQRFEAISSWIELQRQPIPIVLGLISIVAVFTLVSTLLVTVVEKTRSIAILNTLGMTPGQLARIVLLRGLRIGILGTSVGVGISLAFAIIQRTWHPITLDGTIYYVSALPVSLSPAPYLIVPAISLALVVMATVVPILAARRISPARALRFG